MSDRYNYLTVVLERDLKDEEAEPLIAAIKQLRGVLSVAPNVTDATALLAEERVRSELRKKLWQIMREDA